MYLFRDIVIVKIVNVTVRKTRGTVCVHTLLVPQISVRAVQAVQKNCRGDTMLIDSAERAYPGTVVSLFKPPGGHNMFGYSRGGGGNLNRGGGGHNCECQGKPVTIPSTSCLRGGDTRRRGGQRQSMTLCIRYVWQTFSAVVLCLHLSL